MSQHKNLLIAVYDIPSETPLDPKTLVPPDAGGNAYPSPGPSEEMPAGKTVAVFRRASFDEVREHDAWVFGRKEQSYREQSYIALRSQLPTTWSTDVLGGEGLVAEGRQNIWICRMGRESIDGPFDDWTRHDTSLPGSTSPPSRHGHGRWRAIDIGRPSRAVPVTPPGIRVRTTAVRLVKRVGFR